MEFLKHKLLFVFLKMIKLFDYCACCVTVVPHFTAPGRVLIV